MNKDILNNNNTNECILTATGNADDILSIVSCINDNILNNNNIIINEMINTFNTVLLNKIMINRWFIHHFTFYIEVFISLVLFD